MPKKHDPNLHADSGRDKSMGSCEASIARPGTQLFLFFVFLALLGWPMLSIFEGRGLYAAFFIYLFSIWSALIALLIFVARSSLKHSVTGMQNKNE